MANGNDPQAEYDAALAAQQQQYAATAAAMDDTAQALAAMESVQAQVASHLDSLR